MESKTMPDRSVQFKKPGMHSGRAAAGVLPVSVRAFVRASKKHREALVAGRVPVNQQGPYPEDFDENGVYTPVIRLMGKESGPSGKKAKK